MYLKILNEEANIYSIIERLRAANIPIEMFGNGTTMEDINKLYNEFEGLKFPQEYIDINLACSAFAFGANEMQMIPEVMDTTIDYIMRVKSYGKGWPKEDCFVIMSHNIDNAVDLCDANGNVYEYIAKPFTDAFKLIPFANNIFDYIVKRYNNDINSTVTNLINERIRHWSNRVNI